MNRIHRALNHRNHVRKPVIEEKKLVE